MKIISVIENQPYDSEPSKKKEILVNITLMQHEFYFHLIKFEVLVYTTLI